MILVSSSGSLITEYYDLLEAKMIDTAKVEKVTELLPVFLANYIKRFLEKGYDQAFQTRLGQWLVGLGPGKKHALEAIFYALTSFFESRLAENTKLKKLVKEVGIDVAPEISKRMINGTKQEIEASAKTPEEKELAQLLLELEDKDLLGLLNWLYGKEASEVKTISSQLSRLSREEIAKLMEFSPEDREKFFAILNPKTRPKEGRGLLGIMADDINKLNERFEESKRR
ncbi:MAG: hypothetical protein HYS78_01390 [Parcubacteria group bacterium]|nr:hypothetical protein [Parcubacteria group bacterium]